VSRVREPVLKFPYGCNSGAVLLKWPGLVTVVSRHVIDRSDRIDLATALDLARGKKVSHCLQYAISFTSEDMRYEVVANHINRQRSTLQSTRAGLAKKKQDAQLSQRPSCRVRYSFRQK